MASGSKIPLHAGIWNGPRSPQEVNALESSLPGHNQGSWHSVETDTKSMFSTRTPTSGLPLPSLLLSSTLPIALVLGSPFCIFPTKKQSRLTDFYFFFPKGYLLDHLCEPCILHYPRLPGPHIPAGLVPRMPVARKEWWKIELLSQEGNSVEEISQWATEQIEPLDTRTESE